jgi:phage portal protein BeeE/2'-5' RNA ligase
MPGALERVERAWAARRPRNTTTPLDWDTYQEYFTPGFGGFGGGWPWLQTTMGGIDREKVAASAAGAYKSSGPVFSLVLARIRVFSQVRFQWTRMQGSQPGDLFGTSELSVLENPWPNGTTSDLLARMELHDSLAGNAYVRRTRRDRLNVLRPDLVTIILGSNENPGDPALAADTEVAGYLYTPAGARPQVFLPEEVAHFAPIPDPWFHFLGQSWITPVLQELRGDQAATEHKWAFFQNSASPNIAIKFDPAVSIEMVKQFKELLEEEHRGLAKAFKTLYLGGGADTTVVGSSFKDMDYGVLQGRAESRLASAAGVHPTIVGFAEGLAGSSLNAGNFGAARRLFGETTLPHLWGNAAASLQSIVRPPDSRASLWYDDRVPFMRQDASDQASIQSQQASTITALVRDGFTPESAVQAIRNSDLSLLVHSGLVSVQLWEPGSESPGHPGPGESTSDPAGTLPPPGSGNSGNGQVPAAANGHRGIAAAATRALTGYPAGSQPGARSAIISLDLDPGTIPAPPGGVDDHHITVVYLGGDVDDDAFAQACDRAAQAAGTTGGPLTATVAGLSVFPPSESSGGKMPVFAPVDLPGGENLHAGLADLSASEHPDWVPHLTLCYCDPGEPLPDPVPPTPVTFSHLAVHRGGDVRRFALGAVPAAT